MPYLLLTLGIGLIVWAVTAGLRETKNREVQMKEPEVPSKGRATSFDDTLQEAVGGQPLEGNAWLQTGDEANQAQIEASAEVLPGAQGGKYREAARALKSGSTIAEVQDAFGLRKGEAELLARLYQDTNF